MSTLIIPEKCCSICGKFLPATTEYFYKKERGLFGLFSWCKQCHIGRTKSNAQLWNEMHREECRLNSRRHYHRYIERYHTKDKLRREANPEANRKRSSQWAKNNPEKHNAQSCRRRARKLKAKGKYTDNDIALQYRSQNGLCWWCGNQLDPNNYHVDHRMPLSRGGSNFPNNLCVSCPSCNLSKSNKLPHEWIGRLL